MKKTRKIIAFVLFFVLIATISITAYAIDMKVLENHHPILRDAPDKSSTGLGQFEPGDIFHVQHGTYDSSGVCWYGGYPDPSSHPYLSCGHRYGYSIASSFDVYNEGY